MNTLLNVASAYARRGLWVFPVFEAMGSSCACGDEKCEHPAKHPRTVHGHLDATTDLQKVRSWWTRWPLANIGRRPNVDELILDVDPRNGGDESLGELFAKYGAFNTVECLTGGRGRHLYLKLPSGVSIRRKELAPGLDLKTHAGYVIVPPSSHVSGTRYTWEASSPRKIANAPHWLLTLAQQSATPLTVLGQNAIAVGRRNNAAFAIACALTREGLNETAITEIFRFMRERGFIAR
jgi:hypothetical protein